MEIGNWVRVGQLPITDQSAGEHKLKVMVTKTVCDVRQQ